MQTSDQIDQLATALAAAQGEMEHATKDRMNPAFKSRYADLASILDACREPLSKAGLAVLQAPSVDGPMVSVETRLVHKSGQWVSTTITAQVPDGKPTTIGSAVTYLRRYGLAAMAGVAPDDDDGTQASRTAPDTAVADALARFSTLAPETVATARVIAASAASDATKLDRLRDLYRSRMTSTQTQTPQQDTT